MKLRRMKADKVKKLYGNVKTVSGLSIVDKPRLKAPKAPRKALVVKITKKRRR